MQKIMNIMDSIFLTKQQNNKTTEYNKQNKIIINIIFIHHNVFTLKNDKSKHSKKNNKK